MCISTSVPVPVLLFMLEFSRFSSIVFFCFKSSAFGMNFENYIINNIYGPKLAIQMSQRLYEKKKQKTKTKPCLALSSSLMNISICIELVYSRVVYNQSKATPASILNDVIL